MGGFTLSRFAARRTGGPVCRQPQSPPRSLDVQLLGHAPLLARTLFRKALAEDFTERPDEAAASLREAVVLAGEVKDDRLLARILTRLVSVVGWGQRRVEEARRLLPVAQAAVARAGSPPGARAALLYDFGAVLKESGTYDEARTYIEEALAIWQQGFRAERRHVAMCLSMLGQIAWEQGNLDRAQRYLERTVAVSEEALGPAHPETGSAVDDLGKLLVERGAYDQARPLLERALAISETALGTQHPNVAIALNRLATAAQGLGELDEASRHLERALSICEKTRGRDHADCAEILLSQGAVALEQDELTRARACYERAQAIFEKALGPDHHGVACALVNLGELDNRAGDHAAAFALCTRSLAINEASLGHANSVLASDLNCQGTALLGQRRARHALVPLERALRLQQAAPRAPALLAQTQFLLARALWRGNGDRKRALELAQQARTAYADGGRAHETQRAEVDRWLLVRRSAHAGR